MFDNGSKSDAVIFTLKPSFVYQDIIFCGSLSSFGTISLIDGDAPRIYTNGKNDGILKVKSATKTSITLEMAGYSRVIFLAIGILVYQLNKIVTLLLENTSR